MIVTEILEDGRTYTYSDEGFKIIQETGIVYDTAVDTVPHTYTESDELIEVREEQEQPSFFGMRPPVLDTKTITENGTYTAENDGLDGYSEVMVNVNG